MTTSVQEREEQVRDERDIIDKSKEHPKLFRSLIKGKLTVKD